MADKHHFNVKFPIKLKKILKSLFFNKSAKLLYYELLVILSLNVHSVLNQFILLSLHTSYRKKYL